MAAPARERHLPFDVDPVRQESEGDRAGQALDGIAGIGRADAKPTHHDGDARSVGIRGIVLDRLSESVGRTHTVLGDLGWGTVPGRLREALFGDYRLVIRSVWDHHLLTLAAAAIDD